MTSTSFEYVLVGGGLQNGLIALALRAVRPGARIALVERGPRLGGNHTWCFHEADLPEGGADWLEPLVCHRWSGYRVLFPNLERTIEGEYSAISSERFHEVVTASLDDASGSRLFLDSPVTALSGGEVLLETGESFTAPVVIDARGPRVNAGQRLPAGYQKFLGLEVELVRPHGLNLPLLMDATVDQTSGFRFLYLLPLSPTRLLAEDTYFHETAKLNPDQIKLDIVRYLEERGYGAPQVIREETGVLPMPWQGSLPVEGTRPLRAGYGGGWFHPGTGYSFPVACRLADLISGSEPRELGDQKVAAMVRDHRRQARFCHLLNAFLFRWYPAPERWNIFERFYRLPEETIRRFFALQLTAADRFRLLAGEPPRGLSLRYRLQWREQP